MSTLPASASLPAKEGHTATSDMGMSIRDMLRADRGAAENTASASMQQLEHVPWNKEGVRAPLGPLLPAPLGLLRILVNSK